MSSPDQDHPEEATVRLPALAEDGADGEVAPPGAGPADAGAANDETLAFEAPGVRCDDSSACRFARWEPIADRGAPGTIHRYRIGPVIGRGGVGVVHEGWDDQLDREIAIKALRAELIGRPGLAQRFREEARITGRLQHPGIVAIHELGTLPDGRPFFAMNLIKGETLQRLLARRRDPSDDFGLFLSIFEKVCDAVAYAHDRGVIHRDLKSANLMVGAFGLVHVMDWGVAKVLHETDRPDLLALSGIEEFLGSPGAVGDPQAGDPGLMETQLGTIFGTPAFLAPEQARGQIDRVDRRADVFGLGGILCQILTGHPTFTGPDTRSIFAKAVAADVAEAVERLDACAAPPVLVKLAKSCLSPDPDGRPASAVDVAAAITGYLLSERRRAERDLVRFFDLSLDLFCIAHTNGYFDRVNENFTRVLGYSSHDLTSHPFLEFVHPDDKDKTRDVLERLGRGEHCIQFLNRYRHALGHYLWFEWNARFVPEEGVIYAAARDVSERMQETHSGAAPGPHIPANNREPKAT